MPTVVAWLITAAGVLVMGVVLRDLFHSLFHPGGQGGLSRLVLSAVWRIARAVGGRRRLSELAGPLGLVAVIGTWALLLLLGGALVYWPHLPEAFSYGIGLEPSERNDVVDALYLSLVTMSTLGYGDIVPTAGWLRLSTPLQALIGFALLTVAVSWVLQVYPALNRRRTLARRLGSLHRSRMHEAVPEIDSVMPAVVLEDLAGRVVQVTVDLTQYAETYYFRDEDPGSALPAVLTYAAVLRSAGQRSPRADVRAAAADLSCALEDLTRLLAEQFLGTSGGSTEAVLEAYAADHGHAPI